MSSFRPNVLAAGLLAFMVVPPALAGQRVAPEFVGSAVAAATARNAAIELLTGTGAYLGAYEQAPDGAPHDPGITEPHEREIITAFKVAGSHDNRPDAEAVEFHVAALIRKAPEHPVAMHWQVIRDACYPYATALPVWARVEAALLPLPPAPVTMDAYGNVVSSMVPGEQPQTEPPKQAPLHETGANQGAEVTTSG